MRTPPQTDVSGEKAQLANIDEQNVTATAGGDGAGKNASATNVTNPIEKPDDSAQSNAAVGVGIRATAPFTLIFLLVCARNLKSN